MHDGILRDLGRAAEMKKLRFNYETILDVGGNHESCLSFFPDKKITVLNIKNYDVSPKIKFIKASMTKIPFKTNSFDLIISNDTLEHVHKKDRPQGITEMIRVAKKGLIIGVPCGKKAKKYETFVLKLGKAFGKNMKWLSEHAEAQLPIDADIINIIKKNKKVETLEIVKNDNLNIWLFTCILGGPMRFFWNKFDRSKLFKHWKLFSIFNFGSTYRKFFVIYLK